MLRRLCVAVLALTSTLALAGPGAADSPVIAWQAPTPAPGSLLRVEAGKRLRFTVSAGAASLPTAVIKVAAAQLPRGARMTSSAGNPATAVFSWRPSGRQIGERTIRFEATTKAPVAASGPPLRLTIQVVPAVTALSGRNFSHWAYVLRPATVRSAPFARARPVGRVSRWTAENYPNLVSTLEQRLQENGTWVHVRFPKLPNNTTGWVKRGGLGRYHALTTHLVVSRAATRLTLYRGGAVAFRTRVGVGQPRWPTPRGEFYITEKLTGFHNAAYGPLAFGTSARSPVLTDWPGGGFVGLHGTDAPGLIPGHISHGCIRLRNAAILRLARMLPIGTPLTVR
jgi:lipoprotein-anchoring transpeptidase ErfK/SrfK